jgi:DNA helicase IV
LCYNVKLKEFLQDIYSHENISFYTIDGLACKLCNTNVANYSVLRNVLSEMYGGSFPYQHVIIDEGQDFELADEMDIINLLKMNVLDDESRNGSFYLFYDKNQMVQSHKVPEYIDQADCRLTLYRNCRNTFNIATTSMRLLGSERKPKLLEGALEGELPELFVASGTENTVNVLNTIIDNLWGNDYKNIQILTSKTEETSVIAGECSTGVYIFKKKKIPFTTCRKFKGLEADAVILLDITRDELTVEGDSVLYVGSSRAKYRLMLICDVDERDCDDILSEHGMKKAKKPVKAMAAMYNAKLRES